MKGGWFPISLGGTSGLMDYRLESGVGPGVRFSFKEVIMPFVSKSL